MYDKFIQKYKNQVIPASVYTEKHHILPKHVGGTNEQDNIIVLTYRQHILAHLLLYRKYRRIEDITDDRIMVAMPMDEKHRPVIPAPGEHLMCKAGGKGTSYRFFAIYKDKGRDPIPVLFISRPDVVEKVQNREFVRVQVTRPVVLRAIGDDARVLAD